MPDEKGHFCFRRTLRQLIEGKKQQIVASDESSGLSFFKKKAIFTLTNPNLGRYSPLENPPFLKLVP